MVRKKKKREDEVIPWCYYCDRKFADESTLIQHQKAKHFKCSVCHKKLSSASGLRVHCSQVHRFQISTVPAAKPGRESMEVEVFGMAGIPAGAVPGAVPADDEEPAAKAARTDAPPMPPPVLPAPGPPALVPPRHLAPAALAPPPLAFVPPPFPMHPGMPPPFPYLPPPGLAPPPVLAPPPGLPGMGNAGAPAGAPPGMPQRPVMVMHGAPPPGWPVPGYPPPGAMHFGPPPPQPGQAPVFPIAPASGGVPAAAPAPGGGFAPPNPAPLFPIDQASGGVPAAAPAPGGGFAPQNPAPLFPIGSAPAPAFMPPTAAAGSSAGPAQNGGMPAHGWLPPGAAQPAAALQQPNGSAGGPSGPEQADLAGATEDQSDDVSPEEARARQPKYQAKLAGAHALVPG